MDLSTSAGLASAAFEVVKNDLDTLLGNSEITTSGHVATVWGAVVLRCAGNATAKQSIADLKKDPDNEGKRAAFRLQLEKLLEKDAKFQDELRRLLKKEGK